MLDDPKLKTFSISTLGCRANQADSARLRAILLGAGMVERPFGESVDYPIVNTCTVTAEADRKSRQEISKALRFSPQSKAVVATGCGTAMRGGLGKVSGAVLLLPPDKRESILALLDADACPGREDIALANRTARALLKVQDGCDQFCTFCIVPYVRGRSKSVPIDKVVSQAVELERSGFNEIVLTGIHLSTWGHDQPGEVDLKDLVSAIIRQTKSISVRLASLEPDRFPLSLIELMAAEERVCPYLHLVLQHASDKVLKKMHRGYTQAHYRNIVDRFFELVPQAALSSDIMVGFPGETENDFQILFDYLESTPYYHLHVFPYSARPGTAASKFPDKVASEVKKRRRDILLALSKEKRAIAMAKMIGARTTAIFEGEHEKGVLKGTLHNGMAVVLKAEAQLRKQKVSVLVVGTQDQELLAELT